ncbi:MAG: aldo/keto reductase [Snowella sp.]|nr:aldo/keto reductase [Snowella sp.]
MVKTCLGFGCAPMLGRVAKQESLKALEIAYSEKINYFDIARTYGWGQAESLLGEFLVNHKIPRNKVEITTKFGLVPNNNQWIRTSKAIARKLINYVPRTHSLIKTAASKVAAPEAVFTLENAKTSLKTSLNYLQTDYIDNILFHEYNFQESQNNIQPILEFLIEVQQSGMIKNYGFSTSLPLNVAYDFLESHNIKPNILQIPCRFFSPFEIEILQKLKQKNIKIIFHSPFQLQPNISSIFKKIEDKGALPYLESMIDIQIRNPEDLYKLILSYFCVFYSPYSIITSMFNVKHITENNKIVNHPLINPEKADNLHSFFLKTLNIF